MNSAIRSAHEKAKAAAGDMIALSGNTLTLRRYTGSDVDDLTGDPIDPQSRTYIEYKIPCQISDVDDYRAKRDFEYTGDTIRQIRVFISDQNRIYPLESDVFYVEYGGENNWYTPIAIRNLGRRLQIDLKRLDRQ